MELDKDIIESFQEESNQIIKELRTVIEALEDHQGDFPKNLLEEFANKSDRIMGTAKTFETMCPDHKVFGQIGKFGELCKATGYKASTLNIIGLVPIFAAFWADTIDIMEELCENIGDSEKLNSVTKEYIPTLQKRLIWLAEQIVNKTKGSNVQAAINVDGILKRMGIEV
ncbi:MAG: hypothetical protein AB7I27_13440 [Bacteriovoracaceae bacterium]